MVKKPNLPYYLPIVGFIPFTRILALYEIQSHPGFELRLSVPFPMMRALAIISTSKDTRIYKVVYILEKRFCLELYLFICYVCALTFYLLSLVAYQLL